MSATIIAFPGLPAGSVNLGPIATQVVPPICAVAIATKFNDHFLPVVQASMDLLEAGEQDFEARCLQMLDVDGTAMINELCEELQTVGRQMKLLADELDLTRTRLRTAMARLAHPEQLLPRG